MCVQILREERKRILERRQGVEMEQMKQETVQALMRVDETKVQNLELALGSSYLHDFFLHVLYSVVDTLCDC